MADDRWSCFHAAVDKLDLTIDGSNSQFADETVDLRLELRAIDIADQIQLTGSKETAHPGNWVRRLLTRLRDRLLPVDAQPRLLGQNLRRAFAGTQRHWMSGKITELLFELRLSVIRAQRADVNTRNGRPARDMVLVQHVIDSVKHTEEREDTEDDAEENL